MSLKHLEYKTTIDENHPHFIALIVGFRKEFVPGAGIDRLPNGTRLVTDASFQIGFVIESRPSKNGLFKLVVKHLLFLLQLHFLYLSSAATLILLNVIIIITIQKLLYCTSSRCFSA